MVKSNFKFKKTLRLLFFFIAFFGLCFIILQRSQEKQKSSYKANQDHLVNALLWQQSSEEYVALCNQIYALARIRLDQGINENDSTEKPLAIIIDLDETVLDNTPFLGKLIELEEEFNKSRWMEWGAEKQAKAVPGALGFLNYVASRNVSIFYVSNRFKEQLSDTQSNLKSLGFPSTNRENILLRDIDGSKVERRRRIENNYTVLLYIGDNLADFHNDFEDRLSLNLKSNNLFKSEFGKKFIILPNPIYGAWETDGIFLGQKQLSHFNKDSLRRAQILSY